MGVSLQYQYTLTIDFHGFLNSTFNGSGSLDGRSRSANPLTKAYLSEADAQSTSSYTTPIHVPTMKHQLVLDLILTLFQLLFLKKVEITIEDQELGLGGDLQHERSLFNALRREADTYLYEHLAKDAYMTLIETCLDLYQELGTMDDMNFRYTIHDMIFTPLEALMVDNGASKTFKNETNIATRVSREHLGYERASKVSGPSHAVQHTSSLTSVPLLEECQDASSLSTVVEHQRPQTSASCRCDSPASITVEN
jgi:hypothetical protein